MSNDAGQSALLPELMRQADAAYAAGDWAGAERLCGQALRAQADHVPALSLLGIIKAQSRRTEEAAVLLQRVAAAMPENPVAQNNYANVLKDLRRFQEATECYGRAIALNPGYVEAYNNRAAALLALNRPDAALDSYAKAIELQPDNAQAHYNRGVTLHGVGRVHEALDSYARTLAIEPRFAEAYYNQGIALQALGRLDEAIGSYRGAIQARANFAEAYNNLGSVLRDRDQAAEALECYAKALQINPALVEAHVNRAHTLTAHTRPAEALVSYELALKLMPDRPWLYGAWLYTKLQLCDWSNMPALVAELHSRVGAGRQAVQPMVALAVSDDLPFLRRVAEITARAIGTTVAPLPTPARRGRSAIIRLGYFAADFHSHATAHLTAGLYEQHDRRQFAVIALSFGPNRSDPMRERLLKAFDRFVDVRGRSDREIAQLCRELQIDIAVDLKSYTRDARPGIFVQRAAPLQVSLLGSPGTTGAPWIDYLIADPVVIPQASRTHYTESVVYLPHSYYVNDRKRAPVAEPGSRTELGLPPEAFVFCSFNSQYKITAATFEGWMRILRQVPGSVLWIYTENQAAVANLRQQAMHHGVDGARLIFAGPLPNAQHMARQPAADLLLDTFPCGGHTTTSDALWAGLPVLTRHGESFQSRVATSVLQAIGLGELATASQEEYEALAISLATDPVRMQAIRARLGANRLTTPLFDTALYTHHIETAYREMYERYQTGLKPADIHIAPTPGAQA